MLCSGEGVSLWMRCQRAESIKTWLLKHKFIADQFRVLVHCLYYHWPAHRWRWGPLSEMSNSCHRQCGACDSASHGFGFSAGNICRLGAEIFLWIWPLIFDLHRDSLGWCYSTWTSGQYLIDLLLENSMSYQCLWACSEGVRRKPSYLGAGINEREGR